MDIKIKPVYFGKFKITDGVLDEVEKHTHPVPKKIKEVIGKEGNYASVLITQDKELLYTVPIISDDKMIIGKLCIPPILYFNLSIDFLNIFNNIKQSFFDRNKEKKEQGIVIDEEIFNTMISYKMSAIIMLDTAIDSSINYLIPDEFEYYSPSKKRQLNKLDIENLPFKDKLKEVFSFLFHIDITKEYTQLYNRIIVNHKFRKHFVHLSNTKNKQKVEIFYDELGKSINLEMEETITQTIELLNKVKPNTFITKPYFNHLVNVYKDKQLQTICHPVVNLITIETAVTDILIE